MAHRLSFENSQDIGCFSILTSSYCIVAPSGAMNFFSAFEAELIPHGIPVIRSTVATSSIIGRLAVGNKHGLLLPNNVTDAEMLHIRNSLPEEIVVQRVEERLSALGNVIACNDHVALIHPDLDRETEQIVADVLKVETFRHTVAGLPLVGTYCKFTNLGALVHPLCSREEQEELSSLLQVPVVAGTLNRGTSTIGAAMVANDWVAFVGRDTTSTELAVMESVFQLKSQDDMVDIAEMQMAMMEGGY
eukprot:gnl/Dysnectes_brevis/732_a805_6942.p1 GENE.gnl/Dysnectes_brevis/732_a805_6942~~gnl/Dysnectes_brevis/732_a805_6942.p1  ORF type:complete len:247 (-),score=60.20 gnl/Dysnectes_brevis/732_a805_6942:34-774(-)